MSSVKGKVLYNAGDSYFVSFLPYLYFYKFMYYSCLKIMVFPVTFLYLGLSRLAYIGLTIF